MGIEGVNPEPVFFEPGMPQPSDITTFPSDFEDIYHPEYLNHLFSQKEQRLLRVNLYASNPVSSNLVAILRLNRYSFGVKAEYNRTEETRTKEASLGGKTLLFEKSIPTRAAFDLRYNSFWYNSKAELVSAGISSRSVLPFSSDVVALDFNSGGALWKPDDLLMMSYPEAKDIHAWARLRHQHHFATFFGEEVEISAGYLLGKDALNSWQSHRLFSFLAVFSFKEMNTCSNWA
jgi:hypothetical protein